MLVCTLSASQIEPASVALRESDRALLNSPNQSSTCRWSAFSKEIASLRVLLERLPRVAVPVRARPLAFDRLPFDFRLVAITASMCPLRENIVEHQSRGGAG